MIRTSCQPPIDVIFTNCRNKCVNSGFRLNAGETCALLGCYAAYSRNSLPTFKFKKSLDILTLEDVTDKLSRNFGKNLS